MIKSKKESILFWVFVFLALVVWFVLKTYPLNSYKPVDDFSSRNIKMTENYMIYTDGFPNPSWEDPQIIMPMRGVTSEDVDLSKEAIRPFVLNVERVCWNDRYIAAQSKGMMMRYRIKGYADSIYQQQYKYYIIDSDQLQYVHKSNDKQEFEKAFTQYFGSDAVLKQPQEFA